jgi:hypothetical protein
MKGLRRIIELHETEMRQGKQTNNKIIGISAITLQKGLTLEIAKK